MFATKGIGVTAMFATKGIGVIAMLNKDSHPHFYSVGEGDIYKKRPFFINHSLKAKMTHPLTRSSNFWQ